MTCCDPPGWRLQNCNEEQKALHKKILSWFRDENKGENPFSLHSLMDIARSHGNQPGQWFGPAQVALMLRYSLQPAILYITIILSVSL